MDWIDAHCHLADPRYSDESLLEGVLERSRQAGIGRWIQGGVDPDDWRRQRFLAERYPGRIVPCFGLHPWWVAALADVQLDTALGALERELAQWGNRPAGIGELGLDFGKRFGAETHDLQLEAFKRQLDIARACKRPIVLHIVQAHETALKLLETTGKFEQGGLVHSFSGSRATAERYLRVGLTLSISGVIARKGFESLKKAVVTLPPDSFVLETDSPDQSFTSGLNEPARLRQVAEAVARLRNEDPIDLLTRSARLARKIFLGNFV